MSVFSKSGLFNKAKKESEAIDMGHEEWSCCGTVYLVPYLSGDRTGQERLYELADSYDAGITGLPSVISDLLGEFMYEILKILNDVKAEDVRKLANKKTVQEVINLWLMV